MMQEEKVSAQVDEIKFVDVCMSVDYISSFVVRLKSWKNVKKPIKKNHWYMKWFVEVESASDTHFFGGSTNTHS